MPEPLIFQQSAALEEKIGSLILAREECPGTDSNLAKFLGILRGVRVQPRYLDTERIAIARHSRVHGAISP
jgi:hypothetical protein